MSSATPQERARRLIDQNANMVLATANVEGVPWISPVFYVTDERYDMYWTSWVEARHSANVREHPPVAIVVYDEPPTSSALQQDSIDPPPHVGMSAAGSRR